MKKIEFLKIADICIWSENWKPLAEWYQTIFQLELVEEVIHPQDTGRLFKLPKGEAMLWVGQHSEIKGKNLDPHRIMVDFEVVSVQEAYEYLLSKKVEVIAKPFKAPASDLWFAKFADPDGNIFQVIGQK